ncbi:MAG: hypothetical protein KDA25_03120 [Phycisphaerales bacterium]|nr:hypothetical protein [Phycisphaerales bacterium]
MNTRRLTIVAAALSSLAVGSATLADTVDVNFVGVGLGRNVRIDLNSSAKNVFAGQLVHNFANGTGDCASLAGNVTTFCTELTQYVNGGVNEFDCVQVEDAPNTNPMGTIRANAIGDLYAYAAGAQFASASTNANKDLAAAFQIAVWEIANDYDGTSGSLDLSSGTLKVTNTSGGALSAGISTQLSNLFSAVGLNAGFAGLRAVSNSSYQDQLVLIPLPAPVLIGLAGLGAVVIRRRRIAAAG